MRRFVLGLSLLAACGGSRSADSGEGSGTAGESTASSGASGSTTGESSASSSEEAGSESTGMDWSEVPCMERPAEFCGEPLSPGGEYSSYCAWTEMTRVPGVLMPSCEFGELEGVCLTYSPALDGCAGAQPFDCPDGYTAFGVLFRLDEVDLIMDLTDACMVPHEVENCLVGNPDAPGACACGCQFVGGG